MPVLLSSDNTWEILKLALAMQQKKIDFDIFIHLFHIMEH